MVRAERKIPCQTPHKAMGLCEDSIRRRSKASDRVLFTTVLFACGRLTFYFS